MGTSITYSESLPNLLKLAGYSPVTENYTVEVGENDTDIRLAVFPSQHALAKNSRDDFYHIILTVEQAKELVLGLQDAISKAEGKL